jgi:CDGSH-type Zn-finger protein
MNSKKKPVIVCLQNGPYYLIEDSSPQEVPHLLNKTGQPYSTLPGVALCRCGLSKNKPFCDGSHGILGFSDKKSDARVTDHSNKYVGEKITILFNGGACAHAAHCVNDLPTAFSKDGDPWILPDSASITELIKQVEKCPSGALSYSLNNEEQKKSHNRPGITVLENGPYAVTGGVDLVNQKWCDGVSNERYVLCRCGASKNKPFCDGSHISIGFKDNA